MRNCRGAALLVVGVLTVARGCAGGSEDGGATSSPSASATGLAISASGLASLDAISTDAGWLVGSVPRAPGASAPQPLVRLDRATGQQTVLCDWADESLGYCSYAEQGGMIPERPQLLLELVDDNAVRGWFPDGGVFLVDTGTGQRSRIDVDASGTPLRPAWAPADCGGECDYHQVPRLHITTDGISADGGIAAFCTNYDAPREPQLWVKDLGTGALTQTGVRCGVTRFGREDDDDEWADEAMSYPQVSADGSVVHLSGDQSTGGEYGRLGWQPDTLYLTRTGEARLVPGSGAMTRDGRTLYLRSGTQPEVPEADVTVDYVSFDVASGSVASLPWLRDFLATPTAPAPVPDLFTHASDDGRLVLNATTVHDVPTGRETDVAAMLRARGHDPTEERGALRISGDGSTIAADVVAGEPTAESNHGVVLITGWPWEVPG